MAPQPPLTSECTSRCVQIRNYLGSPRSRLEVSGARGPSAWRAQVRGLMSLFHLFNFAESSRRLGAWAVFLSLVSERKDRKARAVARCSSTARSVT